METTDDLPQGKETKLFDPQNCAAGSGAEVLDASVVRHGDRWWMYLAGQASGQGATQLFSASLDPGVPLSALGWNLPKRNPANWPHLPDRK